MSIAEQIALYESLNSQAGGAEPNGTVMPDHMGCEDPAAGGEVMKEARASERIEGPLEINVTWPATQQVKRAVTKDFSDGGAFVYVVFEPQPPIDTEMNLQLNNLVMGKNRRYSSREW